MNGSGPQHSTSIKTLSDVEILRERTAMFIGSVEAPTQLLIEAIDNARDECISGYSNRIDVFTVPEGDDLWYVVRDWGRGIPMTAPDIPDVPLAISTKLFSGGKFGHDLYTFSSGLHGVGLKVVNALSKRYEITTKYDEVSSIQYVFEDGALVTKKVIPSFINDFSTEIRFIPNEKFFRGTKLCNMDEVLKILKIAKYGFGSSVTINYEGSPLVDTLYQEFLGEDTRVITADYTDRSTHEYCKLDLVLCENTENGNVFNGIVNLLMTNEGTHQSLCQSYIKDTIYELSQKNKYHLLANDLLHPIKILCTLKILHPEFPAQVKGKLATDKKEIANLIRSTFEKLVTKRNSAFFDDWFKLAESYRIRLTHRKKTGKIAKVHGLVDCASRDNIHTELFLIEGDSAGGSLMKSRDKNLHAVLPLRGKLLNVAHKKATKDKILTNDVITNISAAVGFKPFTAIDPSSCRYGRVNIMADADPDGKHINCLLITLFYRLFPELIKDGRIYLMVPPLYGVHIKNQFIPIYTEEEMASYRSNHNTMRYKGLGEMSADEIYYCAFEQNTRRAIRLEYEDFDINKLWKDELGILPNVAYVEV